MIAKDAKIYVSGHRGMVGSAIVRRLQNEGYHNLLLRGSEELDLRDQLQIASFFSEHRPQYVFLAAAKVGGIQANNTYRADFLYDNLMIQSNVIHQSYLNQVRKLVFLGSSCIYPKMSEQPIKEEYLLTGPLEHTNEPYAMAKLAGLKLCETYRDQHGCNFISLMPTNLYGPNDNYDLQNAHVLPALLRKFHEAKSNSFPEVTIWGSGSPIREFMHVDDLADACLFLLTHYNERECINIGTGEEISIKDLALLIKDVTGYKGDLVFDTSMPDGTPRKLLDVSKLHNLGWRHSIDLNQGVAQLYSSINWGELVKS